MTLRLASMLALSLAACATDPADDPQGGRGGGGKTDDTCESAAYGTWVRGELLPAIANGAEATRAAITTKPCSTGSDDDYVLFDAVWEQTWQPVYERAKSQLFRAMPSRQDQYDAALAAATPTPAERALLEAIAEAKPSSTGVTGYRVWLDRYAALFSATFTGKGTSSQIFEANATVNAAEEALLSLAEAARPETSVEGGYAAWFEAYYPKLDQSFAATADASYATFNARFLESRPASARDIDYLTFFQSFYADEESTYQGTPAPAKLARLDAFATAAPGGAGGSRSFKPWFGVFKARFSEALGTDLVFTLAESARLERLLTVKPCSTNPDDQTTYDQLASLSANFGTEGAALVERAAPATCE